MELLYRRLKDDVSAQAQCRLYTNILKHVDLMCGVCDQPMAAVCQPLTTLTCGHILHSK